MARMTPRFAGLLLILLSGASIGAATEAGMLRLQPQAPPALVIALSILLVAFLVVSGFRGRWVPILAGLAGIAGLAATLLMKVFGLAPAQFDVIGVVGTTAALVTLVLVQRQIRIALHQVALARREIKLVSNDLAYSREQSSLTQAQLTELARRPELSITFIDGNLEKVLQQARAQTVFSADLLIHNRGSRTARDAYVEVLIPWQAVEHDLSDVDLSRHADTEVVAGMAYRRFGKQISEPIYQDLERRITVFSQQLVANPRSFSLLWRLRDDYAAYPGDGSWGTLEVRYENPESGRRLQFMKRWNAEPYPMLAWDRSFGDAFVYASLIPDPSPGVAVFDEALQQRVERLVLSMPGLERTSPKISEIGVEFIQGAPLKPLSNASTDELKAATAYERGRHRCFVRADGAVEVRQPVDDGNPVYQLLRTLADTYAIATMLHHELATEARGRGRFAYKLNGAGSGTVGEENELWLDMRLSRDEFVEITTPIVMSLQRAGHVAPVESETRNAIEQVWAPYAARLSVKSAASADEKHA